MDFGEILERWERGRGGGRGVGAEVSRNEAGDTPQKPRELPEGKPSRSPEARPEGSEGSARAALGAWLDRHGVPDDARGRDSDLGDRNERERSAAEARRLEALEPGAVIDLHGMRADAAEAALEAFLSDSARAGLEKVLVVHGKGNHSEGSPVLGRLARRVIEASRWTGRYGVADRRQGGAGALWVHIRKKPAN